ncbi:MAG: hypothetical protein A2X35_02950 [Elusimicrobia bacterium GWA2_61_42]|nr:MAG: hypothetical protein A2X35_02950 [Elusimicrobia bacterium GWA2_61_42]OGR74801.1 MAG: hypothetical protein A2X38_08545 [Elusimicrobia bacterium GWC2_61_25]
MPRLSLHFILLPFLVFCGSGASAQGLGPVAEDAIELSTAALLEQLASIPDYSVAADTIPVTEADVQELEEGEDAEAYIFISSALAQTPQPVNLGGNGRLTLTRYDNGEKLTVRYRLPDGSYDPEALAKLDHHMRCSLTGRETKMSVKLIELLDAVEDRFGKKGLTLLSGYRTPRNNGRTPGASRHSLHMLGWAADIKVSGYSSTKIKKYGQKLWVGGVGYYPYKGFTHLDVGKARYWVVGRPPRRRRVRRNTKPAPARKTTARRKAPAAKTSSKPGASKRKS